MAVAPPLAWRARALTEARVKSGLWVAAYVRRCHAANCPAFVTRKGDPDAGAILIVIDRLDGTSRLYGRARDGAGALVFAPLTDWADALTVQAAIDKQVKFDSDVWLTAVESRTGEAFLDEY